jgi:hypothetical protein
MAIPKDNILTALYITITALIGIFVYSLIQSNSLPPSPPSPKPKPTPQPSEPSVGGCKGTRYGCCPDEVTPCADEKGDCD